MARHYQDFVGLNTFIYEPNGWSAEDQVRIGTFTEVGTLTTAYLSQNTLGWVQPSGKPTKNIEYYKNFNFPFDLPTTASFFNALMSHRGNVYGYPTWRQIRISNNPLSRRQRKNNIFTYVRQPGEFNGTRPARYGDINVFREPVVVDSYKPLSLVGDVSVYNERRGVFQDRSVELKASFGNETIFFANKEVDEYFDTALETDDGYEELKELYLDGGLEDDGSPIDAFNLLIYRQSVFPKQQYSYLNKTRSRTFFVSTFWRDEREQRTQIDVDTGFGLTVPSQSMWPLDVAADWATRPQPQLFSYTATSSYDVYSHYIGGALGSIPGGASHDNVGGFNTGVETMDPTVGTPTPTQGAAGILMNSYALFARGHYETTYDSPDFDTAAAFMGDVTSFVTSSAFYSRLHTYNSIYSVVGPCGIKIEETGSLTSIATGSLFEGNAAWDCGNLAGKNPFYDSYDKFAEETRSKGKGFSIVPEFRISSHVDEYLTMGVTEELTNIFEISGGLSQNSTTQSENNFYEVLSTSDFLKHFDLVKKDHKDFARESILTLKCKAIKKFLPYEGFYPAQQTVDIAKEFRNAIVDDVVLLYNNSPLSDSSPGIQGILEPLFAPGVLFNTIKSGVAVDYPIVLPSDNPFYLDVDLNGSQSLEPTGYSSGRLNYLLAGSDLSPFQPGGSINDYNSIWSKRIDFESLVEPERLLSNLEMFIQDPHPFALRDATNISYKWGGKQRPTYKKKVNNFLAEVAEMFLDNSSFTTIVSDKEDSPNFGNAVAGNYYSMRLKMYHTRNKNNFGYNSWGESVVVPPQDIHAQGVSETFTMYSRPSAFGIGAWGTYQSGSDDTYPLDPLWGNNYCYTPPYYYGEAWCDLIFYAEETKKYTLEEIFSGSSKYPYYTRFWNPGIQDALRDLTGYYETVGSAINSGPYSEYSNSPWKALFDEDNSSTTVNRVDNSNPRTTQDWGDTAVLAGTEDIGWRDGSVDFDYYDGIKNDQATVPPHHPAMVNYNAMQLDSSVNIFGKGTVREMKKFETGETLEVVSDQTVRGKTRWIIQTKFETPMLNFNKYANLADNNCTVPQYASESVPRGMWHQYGEIPQENEGVFLQVTDVPESWLSGALNVSTETYRSKVKSLADLVGFSKDPVRLGEIADVKEISEAVVAVPFIEKGGTRQFFSIPRVDIDSCIDAARREVEPGNFVAGGPPKAGDSVYQMVKKMKKYVFPPSMDFVRYKEVDPFAMYIFEFKHNLSKQDLADIWQNLPPEIGTRMEEAEATISHELLAHELLGGGSVVKNGTLDDNAEGNGMPSNIQWMVFKAKKRAKTNYFDKVVAKKGTTEDTSSKQLENASGQTGDDLGITYNWPYDFFSLVELVKLDAEVTFANIENDDKGQKTIKKIEKKSLVERQKERMKSRNINIARGKGRPKK